jgi:signal transduction histidine kinase
MRNWWSKKAFKLLGATALTPILTIAASAQSAGVEIQEGVAGGNGMFSFITNLNVDTNDLVTTTVFLGSTLFALFAAIALVRERGITQRENNALKQQLADVLAQNEQSSALIDVDDQRLVLWPNADTQPIILGNLPSATGIPVERGQFLAFGRWLEPDSAAAVDGAIDRLRRRAEGFDLNLRTYSGALLEAQGRTSGAAAFVRFVDLTGDRAMLAQLEGEHRHLASTLDTVQSLMQSLHVPTWMRSADGRLSWVNDCYLEAVGAESVDAVVAKNVELLSAEDRKQASLALEKDGTFRGRVQAIISGNRRPLDVVETRSSNGFAGVAIDASEAETAKANLERTFRAHSQTLDQITSAVATFDEARTLISFNSAFQSLWDVPEGFLAGRPTHGEILERLRSERRLSEPSDWRSWKEEHLSVYSGNEAYEVLLHLPDARTVHVVATPQRGGGVTWVYENLTDRLELEGRYDTLTNVQGESLEHLVEGVAVFGSDGRLRLSNTAFGRMWGLEDEERAAGTHIGQLAESCAEIDASSRASQVGQSHHWLSFATEITGLQDKRLQTTRRITLEGHDGGRERVYDCAVVPLPDAQTMITFVNVTDSVNVAAALTERNEALEASEVLKNAFVANMSYELRTLLTNIKGFTEVLLSGALGALNDQQSSYMGDVHDSAGKLEAIVDSMLDLASIDAGILELEVEQVDAEQILAEIRVRTGDTLAEKDLTLRSNIGKEAKSLNADRKRLTQILMALMSNAVRFSPEGSEISVSTETWQGGIAISVSDQGPGIDPEFAEAVFGRFEGQTSGGTRKGAGLGLAVVHSLVELHGGEVFIDIAESGSPDQPGTKVTCRFPREIVKRDVPSAPILADMEVTAGAEPQTLN